MTALLSPQSKYVASDAVAPWPDVERALAVVAHPDDVEYSCGGLIQRLGSWSIAVSYLVVSDGGRGGADTSREQQLIAMRREEQIAAGAILGVSDVKFLGFADGELQYHREIEKQVVAAIRRIRPNLLITHDPLTRLYKQHPDHRATGAVALAAAFPASRMSTYYPELLEQGLGVWTVDHALLFSTDAPDWFVEMDDRELQRKIQALGCHASQANSFGSSINQRVPLRAEQGARGTPFRYAEPFKYVYLR